MAAIDDLAIQLANDTGYSIGNRLFKGNLPPVPDNAIAIISTQGTVPSGYLKGEKKPAFQVIIRDDNYVNGESNLFKVRGSLQAKTPTTIGSTYFFYILANAEGGWIGRDDNGRDMWSINFQCMIR